MASEASQSALWPQAGRLDTRRDSGEDVAVNPELRAHRRQDLRPPEIAVPNVRLSRTHRSNFDSTSWRPRLEAFSPNVFGLQEIAPSADGVVLDYATTIGISVSSEQTHDRELVGNIAIMRREGR